MSRIRICLVALLVSVSGPARAADLLVSAASSLANAMREIGPAFEAVNPGTRVVFNLAASDALVTQIDRGAPVDVFASADQETMDRAEARRLIVAGSRRDFAGNSLVMVVPAASPLGLTGLSDLRRSEVARVAMGNPAGVPAGRYTRAALESAQLWSTVEPRAILAQSVRQALDYVARGEVDAGFVYATDAAIMKDRVRVVATVATGSPITYPVAVVANGPNPAAARGFVDYLAGPAAQAVLARHGFTRP